jgi:hypothetical protein
MIYVFTLSFCYRECSKPYEECDSHSPINKLQPEVKKNTCNLFPAKCKEIFFYYGKVLNNSRQNTTVICITRCKSVFPPPGKVAVIAQGRK